MERRQYNKLKIQVLTFIRANPDATTRDLSMGLGIEIGNAGMALFRLFRQRLLERHVMVLGVWRKPPFQYSLTERGIQRLEYLEGLI